MTKLAKLTTWILAAGLVLLTLSLLACSSSATSTTAPNTSLGTKPTGTSTGTSPGAVTINVSAKNMAFDTTKITVQAGAQVTLVFANNDSGVPHNVAFYTDKSASTSIYVGQTIRGVATATYTFTAPSAPGTYFFRCDIHPSIMTGDFVVTPITQ